MLAQMIVGGILVLSLPICAIFAYRIGFRDGRDVGQEDAYKLFNGGQRIIEKREKSHTDAA